MRFGFGDVDPKGRIAKNIYALPLIARAQKACLATRERAVTADQHRLHERLLDILQCKVRIEDADGTCDRL